MTFAPAVRERIASEFPAARRYLNTASVGLPSARVIAVLEARLAEWRDGRCEPASFDPDVARARAAYARVVGTDPAHVGVVAQASVVAGLVASSLPVGTRVLCAEEDFTSVLFPFLADRRLQVRLVPLASLLDHVDGIDLVAVSLVQSADGRVLDLAALVDAARAVGARTYLDVTQAAGWMPLDVRGVDVTACSAYKWLGSPRGAAFLTVDDDSDWLVPRYAGWFAGDDPWQSIYGPPLRLAPDARRFDASPAWFAWSGAVPALELVNELGVEHIHAHSVGLANRFREHVGLGQGDSAIVSIDAPADALTAAGFRTASRAGRTRLSFHFSNTIDDADEAAAVLREAGLAGDVAAVVDDA